MSGKVTLAIEAAIGGGSVALAREGAVLAGWEGESGDPQSENLLTRVSDLMTSVEISKRDLNRIVCSNGPGSYTGIRVGIATAVGLAAALRLPCSGVSILNSVARTGAEFLTRVVVVPLGRGNLCWRRFMGTGSEFATGEVLFGPADEFARYAHAELDTPILAQSDAFATLVDQVNIKSQKVRIHDIGRNLARILASEPLPVDEGLEPFYASDARPAQPVGGPVAGK